MILTKGAHQSAKFQTFDGSGEMPSNFKFQIKTYRDLCLMTLKSDAKLEEKPICCFQNDKNLVNFDPSTDKSQKFEHGLVSFAKSK